MAEEKKVSNKEKPTNAPISLFIYSVQVLKTLNFSAFLISGSFIILFDVSSKPIKLKTLLSLLFF